MLLAMLTTTALIAAESKIRTLIQCEAPQIGFEWSAESNKSFPRFHDVGDIRFEVLHQVHSMVQEERIMVVQYSKQDNSWQHSWSFLSPQGQDGEMRFMTECKSKIMYCRLVKLVE